MGPVYPQWYHTLQKQHPLDVDYRRKYDILKGAGVLASGVLAAGQSIMRGAKRQKVEAEIGIDGTATMGDAVRETSSVSTQGNMRKTKERREIIHSSLDIVERPLRLELKAKPVKLSSSWAALRDLVTGRKVLKNSFSFKMTSVQDQRGLLAIPIRHDATLGDMPVDSGWHVGTLSQNPHVAANGFGAYSSTMGNPVTTGMSTTTGPAIGQNNVLIPRLNLPTLEQTSWDLNQFKLLDNSNILKTDGAQGTPNATRKLPIMEPVTQLRGSRRYDNFAYPKGIPGPANSFARIQMQGIKAQYPGSDFTHEFPQFKTQLGGGSMKMRIANQGTNRCTVEFVVVKCVNIDLMSYSTQNNSATVGRGSNATRIWEQLYHSVGYEYGRKTLKNLSYKMGTTGPADTAQVQSEAITSPYHQWLPDSCFKARYPAWWNLDASMDSTNSENLDPNGDLGIQHEQLGSGPNQLLTPVLYPGNLANVDYDNKRNDIKAVAADGTNIPLAGQIGQKTPYRPVARGHCTISGAGERTITIPLPATKFDATKVAGADGTASANAPNTLDGVLTAQMNRESYIVLMSVNGSLQDIIEPNALDDRVKVIGKAYTPATIDVYCQYTESVLPSVCDYASITDTAFNFGSVRGAQITSQSVDAFPGKVLAMSHAVPTCGTGVLRTGDANRAASNEAK